MASVNLVYRKEVRLPPIVYICTRVRFLSTGIYNVICSPDNDHAETIQDDLGPHLRARTCLVDVIRLSFSKILAADGAYPCNEPYAV